MYIVKRVGDLNKRLVVVMHREMLIQCLLLVWLDDAEGLVAANLYTPLRFTSGKELHSEDDLYYMDN